MMASLRSIFGGLSTVLALLACLFAFICSLGLLSTAFKLLLGKLINVIFGAEDNFFNNPFVGLMIGVLGTVAVQSSSTFTSIIEAALGAGVPIRTAIPMIMGANIGTSVTNTLVAMTQMGDKHEFERAFAAATVHDWFNWCTVVVLLLLEIIAHPLEILSGHIAQALVQGTNGTDTEVQIIEVITDPINEMIVRINSSVIKNAGDQSKSCEDCSVLLNCTAVVVEKQEECDYLLFTKDMYSDGAAGAILLALSLVILVVSLVKMVAILNSCLKGPLSTAVKKVLNPSFKSPLATYLFSYVYILIGTGVTFVLQSSSVFTSTLTPMVGVGLVQVDNVYPLFLGSNIGTTFTSFLAALTQGSSGAVKFTNALQGSFVHLFFNIFGILLFYPIPFMRFPLPISKKLGKITAKYRWFAIVYIIGMFVIMPFSLLALSFLGNAVLYTFLAFFGLLISCILIINILQDKCPQKLPSKLRQWPTYLTLEPYDRLMRKLIKVKSEMEEAKI